MRAPAVNAIVPAPWLEVIEGAAPILLIAPHGGRAGAASRSTLHPKVNDLETAAITRDLAQRIGAAALINAGMDRNEIDCNRLSQLADRAPWMLDLIAQRTSRIVADHGHATVLLIHGWNVIEPRIDFGLGLRDARGRLQPPAGAQVSASDEFINGPVSALSARLSADGIIPTFGLRYPGGALQNLLQAFTQRHAASEIQALRRLAELSARGAIDAIQLEMSVAVRMAGSIRVRGLNALTEIFLHTANGNGRSAHAGPHSATLTVQREAPSKVGRKPPIAPASPPARIGVEFYDRIARIGGMASFDFGSAAAGARIMLMFDDCRAALFTGEGQTVRDGGNLRLGPLELTLREDRGTLRFSGPAVIVNDGAAYLSVENALAQCELDTAMEVEGTLEFAAGVHGSEFPDGLIERAGKASVESDGSAVAGRATAIFGRLRGAITILGVRREIDAVARIGGSFTGLEPIRFETRRMLWACFPDAPDFTALEARAWTFADGGSRRTARMLCNGEWRECDIAAIELETPAPGACPDRIAASMTTPQGGGAPLNGVAEAFMTLSRPGPDHSRIHTSIGFASYRVGDAIGAGMFEYSRIANIAVASGDDDDADSD
jgi:hypothetical protein